MSSPSGANGADLRPANLKQNDALGSARLRRPGCSFPRFQRCLGALCWHLLTFVQGNDSSSGQPRSAKAEGSLPFVPQPALAGHCQTPPRRQSNTAAAGQLGRPSEGAEHVPVCKVGKKGPHQRSSPASWLRWVGPFPTCAQKPFSTPRSHPNFCFLFFQGAALPLGFRVQQPSGS